MVDFTRIRAIDFHTHADEPCGSPADDGYDDLQSTMAACFGAPWTHPPTQPQTVPQTVPPTVLQTVPQTAAHCRARNIAAVIFPVDAERETGYRRHANEAVAALAAENADVLIPFAAIDPAKGRLAAREARRLVQDFGIKGFRFHPTVQGFFPNPAWPIPCTRRLPRRAGLPCSTSARPASARACAAATGCS